MENKTIKVIPFAILASSLYTSSWWSCLMYPDVGSQGLWIIPIIGGLGIFLGTIAYMLGE